MPRVNLYLNDDDYVLWQSLERKSEFVSDALNNRPTVLPYKNEKLVEFDDGSHGIRIPIGQVVTTETPPNVQTITNPVALNLQPVANATDSEWQEVGKPKANERQSCCYGSTPCKHWVWDATTGDGYRNTLTNEFRAVAT